MQKENTITPSVEAISNDDKELLARVIEYSPILSAKQTLDGLFIGVITSFNDDGLHIVSVIGLENEFVVAQSIYQLTPETLAISALSCSLHVRFNNW